MGPKKPPTSDLYYEEVGGGVPILLIHPSGATASTWGSAVDELARIGRVITYDRRGYAGRAASRFARSPITRPTPRRSSSPWEPSPLSWSARAPER
jgi:pimeloyl-ACP methyl ester carboxylesterase